MLLHLVPLVMLTAGCAEREEPPVAVIDGRTMGTTYSVQIAPPPPASVLDALQPQIAATLEQVNAEMSTYRADSELSRFNRHAGDDWFPVSAPLAEVVALALTISEQTGGAFDVTVGPLVNLWGFGPEPSDDRVPTAEAIAEARESVGYRMLSVRLDPPALRKQIPDLYVDLSAIAKGHGVDRLAALLDAAGMTDYLLEIGGELRGRGQRGSGRPWRIAIERPDSDVREPFRVVALGDLAMATSGDYRNFFERDGQRFSHTIDPATGRPVTHDLASVTVLDSNTARADAIATALLVLGPDIGRELAEARDWAALFVRRTPLGDQADSSSAFDRLVAH